MAPEVGRAPVVRRVLICVLVAAMAGIAASASAQAPDPKNPREAQPERPTVATHAFTVAPGIVEVEAGVLRQALGDSASLFNVPVLFKIGLGSRVQLDVAPGYLRLADRGDSRAGLTDVAIGLKWRLVDDAPVLGAFAIQPTVTAATGSAADGTGIGTWSINVLAISSHSLGAVALDVNAGYTHRGGDGTIAPKDATSWSVAAGFPITGRVGWCAELFGYPRTTGISGEPGIVGFLTGPSFTIHESVIVDAGVALDVANLGGTQVFAGVTWNMGHAWKPRPSSATR